MDSIKMFIYKLYCSIKGFSKIYLKKYKNFKVESFSSNIKSVVYTHVKGREYIVNMQIMEPTTGVVYFDARKEIVPYWTIGVLNIEKI